MDEAVRVEDTGAEAVWDLLVAEDEARAAGAGAVAFYPGDDYCGEDDLTERAIENRNDERASWA